MCKPFWLTGWLIHVDTWQKPTQHCEAIILQLKINELKKKKNRWVQLWPSGCGFLAPVMSFGPAARQARLCILPGLPAGFPAPGMLVNSPKPQRLHL